MVSMALAAAAAFNLVCSGTMTAETIAGNKREPYTAIYRVDLDRQLWCESECRAHHPIQSVQPGSLTLHSDEVDSPSEKSSMLNQIDRVTGKHLITSTKKTYGRFAMIIIMKYDGQCERQPFTGFPEIETKF